MFKERLEIDSPGQLPNGMTIESMDTSQATRNEVIASVFGRIPVGDVPRSGAIVRYLMERRGDGVVDHPQTETRASHRQPRRKYNVVDDSSLVLSIPAAKARIESRRLHGNGALGRSEPLSGVEILGALSRTKPGNGPRPMKAGEAALDLYTTNLPMTVYAATPGYVAGLHPEWMPNQGGLLLELSPLPKGGAAIFPNETGHLPGLTGRLNPIRDTEDRTYMYADNIAIEEGRQQPVPFRFGKPMKLTDAFGSELSVTIVDIVGRSALVEYRPFAD